MTNSRQISSSTRCWIVCMCSALFFFYEFMQLSLMDSISSDLMASFGITESTLAEISAIYLLAIVVFYFPVGYLFDRVSTRKLILFGIALGTAASLVFAKAPNIYVAEAARFGSGFAHCLAFLGCMRIAARWLPEKLGLVMGWNVTVGLLGGVAAHTPFTYFVTQYGWRDALVVNGLLGIVFFVLTYFIVHDFPKQIETSEDTQPQKQPFLEDLKAAMKNKQNWLCASYTSLLNLPVMLLGALWGTLYLTHEAHITRMQASNVMAMIFYGTIIGSPIVGYISEKMQSRKKPMVMGALLSIAVITLIFIIPNPSYEMLIGLYLVLGLITSTQIISYPAITESNPAATCGIALSFASIIIMGGGGLGQKIFGQLMEINWQAYFPNIGMSNYRVAFLLIPVGFVLALLAALFVRDSYAPVEELEQRPISSQNI